MVHDIDEARDDLVKRGADASEVFHDAGGLFHHAGTEGRRNCERGARASRTPVSRSGYSSRNSTVRDHVVIPEVVPNARSRTLHGAWHGTGSGGATAHFPASRADTSFSVGRLLVCGRRAARAAPTGEQERGPGLMTGPPSRGNEPVLIPMYAKTSWRSPPS